MEAEQQTLIKAFALLEQDCSKILLVNLTKDTYLPIRVMDDEWSVLSGKSSYVISEYFNWFVSGDYLYSGDKQRFKEFVDTLDAGSKILYLRKVNGVYRKLLMQAKPTVNYAPDNKEVILYVKDIDEIYRYEYDIVAERIGTTEPLTKLLNRFAYERDLTKQHEGFTGIMFCDVNGLKYTNDNLGHAEGDKLIKTFANMIRTAFNDYCCYRISGDEFIVASYNCNIKSFLQRVIAFHKYLWSNDNTPVASVGYSIDLAECMQDTIVSAEQAMYEDKEMFYKLFPQLKRK